MDIKKDNLFLLLNNGNVEMRNNQNILIKTLYHGGDAQRADWLNERELTIWVQTTSGKIKQINQQGVVFRIIG
jgi:hypothetical protein